MYFLGHDDNRKLGKVSRFADGMIFDKQSQIFTRNTSNVFHHRCSKFSNSYLHVDPMISQYGKNYGEAFFSKLLETFLSSLTKIENVTNPFSDNYYINCFNATAKNFIAQCSEPCRVNLMLVFDVDLLIQHRRSSLITSQGSVQ